MAMKMFAGSDKQKLVSIRLLGIFDILYKGQTIFDNASHSQKAYEILRYMIVQNDKELFPESIAENIWPSNNYFNIRNVVRTYMFRLKKFLSEDNALHADLSEYISVVNIKGRYKICLSDECSLDTKNLDELSNWIDRESNDEVKIELLTNGIKLYGGQFLEDCLYDQWVIPYRNYYLRIFVEKVNLLLDLLSKQGDYKRVVKVCEDVFIIYDLDEQTNIFFLEALMQENRFGDALQHYSYITNKLYTDLGVKPSDELKKIYNSLKAAQKREPEPETSDSTMPDTVDIWHVVSELLSTHLIKSTDELSVGQIAIKGKTPLDTGQLHGAMESLKLSLNSVLRKRDSYTVFSDSNRVIFILHNAEQKNYSLISSRIRADFKRRSSNTVLLAIEIRQVNGR